MTIALHRQEDQLEAATAFAALAGRLGAESDGP